MKVRTHKSNGPKDPKKYQRSHTRRLELKAVRLAKVEAIQAARDKLTPEEQLAIIAERPGHSTKELHRLEALMRRN